MAFAASEVQIDRIGKQQPGDHGINPPPFGRHLLGLDAAPAPPITRGEHDRQESGSPAAAGACYADRRSTDTKWLVGAGIGIGAAILTTGVGLAALMVSLIGGVHSD